MISRTNSMARTLRKILSILLALMLFFSSFPSGLNVEAFAASDGMIRVRLTRLGSAVSSVTMKTTGVYSCAGKSIASGSTVKVVMEGTALSLQVNGTTLESGSTVTMNRTSGGLSTGVKFTSPSLSNTYHADLIFSISGGAIRTVARMYIETYLYGVVGHEMSNSFPIEALKAQAIAARTYAMRAKSSSSSYDVNDNTTSQVFYGYSSSQANVIAAVDSTKGQCLMSPSGSSYAQCYYTASNGGQTESSANIWGGSLSYLTVKDDPYDLENPSSRVKSATIPGIPGETGSLNTSLRDALLEAAASSLNAAGLGSNRSIVRISNVEPHTPKYAAPSRVYTKLRFTMIVSDGKNQKEVSVNLGTFDQVESMLSLSINSSQNEVISVEKEGENFILSFRRYGHGVGMSQRGAQQMAKAHGKTAAEIMEFYYPGTVLSTLSLSEKLYGTSSGPSVGGDETLQYGSTGEAVKELQRNLKTLGYFSGNVAGNYLTLTEQAVKDYQTAHGLMADGIATPELQKAIAEEANGNPSTPPSEDEKVYATIKLGDTSSRLNVRSGPSTSYKVAGVLPHGTLVQVLGESGKWSQITTGELTGYVMTTYLKIVELENTPTPTPTITPEPTPSAYETLLYGSTGEAVKALQQRLMELGYFEGVIGGNYLRLTEQAVMAYQSAHGLTADGIATPELQALIFGAQTTPAPEPSATPTPTPTPEPTATPEPTNTPEPPQLGKKTGKVKTGGSRLNMRAKTSTSSSVVARIPNGSEVVILSESGKWYQVEYDGKKGYVVSEYIIITNEGVQNTPTPTPTAVPTLMPSTTPSATSTALPTTVPTATPAPTPPVSSSKVGVVTISGSRLNMRSEPSTSSKILGRLSNGTTVKVLGETKGWYQVEYAGQTGYLSADYVRIVSQETEKPVPTPPVTAAPTAQPTTQPTAEPTVQPTTEPTPQPTPVPENQEREATVVIAHNGTLHIRKGPGTDTDSIGYISNGARVTVLGEAGEWYKIRYNGLVGHLKKIYIVF